MGKRMAKLDRMGHCGRAASVNRPWPCRGVGTAGIAMEILGEAAPAERSSVLNTVDDYLIKKHTGACPPLIRWPLDRMGTGSRLRSARRLWVWGGGTCRVEVFG